MTAFDIVMFMPLHFRYIAKIALLIFITNNVMKNQWEAIDSMIGYIHFLKFFNVRSLDFAKSTFRFIDF